jgi:hypothetical protein
MNSKCVLAIVSLALTFVSGNALAQDDDGDLDGTIRLMGHAEAESPDAVTNPITLPYDAQASEAVANSEFGLDTANEARLRREEGLTTADEARESNADFVEAAQENRGNRGRSSDNIPENVPDRPEPPTPPGGG